MAFASYRDNNWEIYSMRPDGAEVARLTKAASAEARPRQSHANGQIAFISNRAGNYDIFTVGPNGESLRQLTSHPAEDNYPCWSPDGAQIAFASNRTGAWDIYVMNAGGAGIKSLTADAQIDFNPIWSPDSRYIAWIRAEAGVTDGKARIWLANADGSNAHPVSAALRYLENLAWSPGQGWDIVFDFDFDGDYFTEAAAIRADGSSSYVEWVYDPGGVLVDAQMGGYSPSGGWIVFTRVEYVVIDNELYINRATLHHLDWFGSLDPGSQLPGSGMDMMADWQRTDFTAPTSRLDPVPANTVYQGLTLRWSGSDAGGSGFHYQVQYRNDDGPWQWLSEYTNDTSIFMAGPVGTTQYYRVRAVDHAGNTEPWPRSPNGDGQTRFFWEGYAGSIFDVRHIPIPGAVIAGPTDAQTPFVSTADGSFNAHSDSDIAALTVSHPGYGALPSITNWNIGGSYRLDVALPPRVDRIQNGGFESGLAGWQVVGEDDPIWIEGEGHSGGGYLLVGNWHNMGVGQIGISQSVAVPVATVHPTLSFFVRNQPGFPAVPPLDVLSVTISEAGGGIQPLDLRASTEAAGWIHIWADLSAWGGKQVTLTIKVTQTLPTQLGKLALDEVSLGEWHTPRIAFAEGPRELPGTITIHGENLQTGAVARMDGNDLATTFIDNTMLTAQLPQGASIGIHDLWVTNPGGEQAQGQALIGKPLFLPLVGRED